MKNLFTYYFILSEDDFVTLIYLTKVLVKASSGLWQVASKESLLETVSADFGTGRDDFFTAVSDFLLFFFLPGDTFFLLVSNFVLTEPSHEP